MTKPKKFGKILIFILTILISNVALAVPTLQLYMPDAEYNEETESWLTYSNPFELQVLGADQPNRVMYIKNVKLHFAVPEQYFVSDGYIHIVGEGIDVMIESSMMNYGQPEEIDQPHGIYPTYYYSVSLPNLEVDTAGETIYNYNPGEDGQDTGDIQYYTVSYDKYFLIHMDLTGIAVWKDNSEHEVFAPYSHDADAAVPEPATLFLIGFGLIGIRIANKFKLER